MMSGRGDPIETLTPKRAETKVGFLALQHDLNLCANTWHCGNMMLNPVQVPTNRPPSCRLPLRISSHTLVPQRSASRRCCWRFRSIAEVRQQSSIPGSSSEIGNTFSISMPPAILSAQRVEMRLQIAIQKLCCTFVTISIYFLL